MPLAPKQITQAPAGAWIGNEYSSVDPFSLGCKHLLLVHHDHFELYSGEGQWLSKLSPVLSASSEPRWSRSDPYLLYYVFGNELRSFDVRTEKSDMVRKFPGSQTIKGRGESDISEDGDRIVLSDDKGQVWIYNLKTDQVTNSYLYTQPFNSLYLTPDNRVLMGTVDRGVTVYGILGWSSGKSIAPTISHMDVGRSLDGREILIRTNSADPQPLPGCPNGVELVDILTSEPRCLTPIDWTYAVHVSCPGKADGCIVSTYSPTNSKPSQILKAKYAGGAEILCDTKSVMIPDPTPDNPHRISYNPQPKAAVARDGSRLVFSSNNGDTSRGPIYCDTFLLMLEQKPSEPPKPEPPIVVQPERDWPAELAVLRGRAELAEEKLANAINALNRAQQEKRGLETLNATTAQQVNQLEQQIDMLTNALVAVRSRDIDPEVWERVTFPNQLHRRWGYEVLTGEQHIAMFDIAGPGNWSRIVEHALLGNDYRLRYVEGPDGVLALEMYSAKDNVNPWAKP